MNDSSFGMVQRFPERELCELKFTPTACFCNDLTLFLISSLIADTIYDFFLGWWVLCFLFFFHSLIKSNLLAGKDLLCLNNEQKNTWSLVDSEFLFSCLTRCRHFHIWYMNVLSSSAFFLPLRLIFCFCFVLLSNFFLARGIQSNLLSFSPLFFNNWEVMKKLK